MHIFDKGKPPINDLTKCSIFVFNRFSGVRRPRNASAKTPPFAEVKVFRRLKISLWTFRSTEDAFMNGFMQK